MTLLDYLKIALHDRNWTIPQAARHFGVSMQLVYKWMAEDPATRITPGPRSCLKIAEALDADADFVLELAGHRKPSPESAADQVSALRQSARAQLEEWLNAVGPQYEQAYWDYLKTHGSSAVILVRSIGTAVNTGGEGAVNSVVSGRAKRDRRPRNDPDSTLTHGQRTASGMLARGHRPSNQPLAA